MKKEKPAVVKTIALDEYVLVAKRYIKDAGCRHMSGFVNIPLLFAKPSEQELKTLLDAAVKHGVIVSEGGQANINSVVYTFLNAWCHSKNVAMLKKVSYSDSRGIAFARVEGMYLAALQDVKKNSVALIADAEFGPIYAYLKAEIEKKESTKHFKRKSANKQFEEKGRDIRLEVDPVNQLFLQCVCNSTGRKVEADTLVNIGKGQIERIRLNEAQEISAADRDEADLEKLLKAYVDGHCPVEPGENFGEGGGSVGGGTGGSADPEAYTRLSFRNLTKGESFPKGLLGLFKMLAAGFFKSLLDWRRLLKGILFVAGMAGLTLVWNLYALCYLNDTFRISPQAIFGNATAYLLGGTADSAAIKGFPQILKSVDTVLLAAGFYYLLAIAARSLVRDVAGGKVRANLAHICAFPASVMDYRRSAGRGVGHYLLIGLAIAAVLNILLFNPFTVGLLAAMLLFSCMKGEEGGISPFLMMLFCSVRYKKVMDGTKRAPLFGELQLRLFGIGAGLAICTLVNIVLWHMVNFSFGIRLSISAAIVLFALMKLGIVRVGRPTAAMIVAGLIAVQAAALFAAHGLLVLADDGGWTESGASIAGLMQNSGWATVFTFSAVLAGAAAFGCLTLGLGTAAAMAAAGAAFGAAGTAAIFTESGRAAAYDFVWGKYSPYGGNSKIASALGDLVSLVPGYGDAFGLVSGLRDCTYDLKEGDLVSLGLDAFGVGLNVCGLSGVEVSDDISDAYDAVNDLVGAVQDLNDAIATELGGISGPSTGNSWGPSVSGTGGTGTGASPGGGSRNVSARGSYEVQKALAEAQKEAVRKAGEKAGCSEEVIDQYLSRLEPGGQGGVSTKELERTLLECRKGYDEGLFDKERYSMDDILKLQLEKNAGRKDYSGIEHGELLPQAEECLSDEAVLEYAKKLCPDSEAVRGCDTLQELAEELAKDPEGFAAIREARIEAQSVLEGLK